MDELRLSTLKSKVYNLEFVLNGNGYSEAFEIERNELIITIVRSIIEFPEKWDNSTLVTSPYITRDFFKALAKCKLHEKTHIESGLLDEIFSYLFTYSLEMHFTSLDPIDFDVTRMRGFAIDNMDKFNTEASMQMTRMLSLLPINIVKDLLSNPRVSDLRNYINEITQSKENVGFLISEQQQVADKYKNYLSETKADWDVYVTSKQAEISEIKTSLEEYKNAFNFVGLYDGFNNLSIKKVNEKRWSFALVVVLGFFVFAPLVYEVFVMHASKVKYSSALDFLTLIPIFSITLILIYYFRVALHNYNSIKAQLSQIELRKTLCQFIQSYGTYAAKMKKDDPESLSKFEGIIFSSIITNGDNIPSTFDGLEQIVKLVGELKKSA